MHHCYYPAFFLTGCTATGKTAVAHWLARRRKAVVLSADAMLVYRGMNIGTAKPTAAEQAEVEYAGIDLVAPWEECNLALYYAAACQAARAAAERQRALIVVGGTGLYLNCLLYGLDRRPAANPSLRAELTALWKEKGIAALQELLRQKAPLLYARMPSADQHNPRRLIRALEVAQQHTGQRDVPDKTNSAPSAAPIPALHLPPAQLQAAIAQRIAAMFAAGWEEEVRALLQKNPPLSATARQAIGYAEVIGLMEGAYDRAEAARRIELRTRQLAKKQMTWFRNKLNVAWLEISSAMDVEARARLVERHWEQYGPLPIAYAGAEL